MFSSKGWHPFSQNLVNYLGMGQNPGTPGEHQNSWDLWMFIPLKMVSIGIDSYPFLYCKLLSFYVSFSVVTIMW